MTKLLFSVIVPSAGRTQTLESCLKRLDPKIQNRDPSSYEVIVSEDKPGIGGSAAIVRAFPFARWQEGPARGPAANRNSAARSAKAPWLVFLDDDCLPDGDLLHGYQRISAEHPECEVFEGRIYADRPRASLSEFSPANPSGGFLWSCNFMISAELFSKIGGFDERFPYPAMEDVELRHRIKAAGHWFTYARDAAVCHPWRERGGWTELTRHRASTMIYLDLHPEERANINSRYYLGMAARLLARDLLPGCWRYRGRGMTYALQEQASHLLMAARLAFGAKGSSRDGGK